MHQSLKGLEERILKLALAALTRANTDTIFSDRGMEHRDVLAPLSAAHAGELVLKALIAREHPLLIFKELTSASSTADIDLNWLLEKGQTHDFSKLPSVLNACTGHSIPDLESFNLLRKTRNQIQHFIEPTGDLRAIARDFIYKNIDPLLHTHFDEYAYQFHEDEFDDYVVECLLRNEVKFSCPEGIAFTEIDPNEVLKGTTPQYRKWATAKLKLPPSA